MEDNLRGEHSRTSWAINSTGSLNNSKMWRVQYNNQYDILEHTEPVGAENLRSIRGNNWTVRGTQWLWMCRCVCVCVEYWPRETVSPESSGTGSANRSEPSFRSWPIRDSRDTIFQRSHGDASKRGWQETRVTGLRVPEFRLSPSERIISFHSHELSEFPVDSRLLERQILGSASIVPCRQASTNSANALWYLYFHTEQLGVSIKIAIRTPRPMRYLHPYIEGNW